MPVRVSPSEVEPTHHFSLNDRSGKKLGLTACDSQGKPMSLYDDSLYVKIPVETTAMKQTSGSSSYDIFDYPYSPIVQDDISGGRASKDFERDSTKYYDSFRCLSGRANTAYAGPLEQYSAGLRSQDQSMPGSVDFVQLTGATRHVYKRFQASASYTAGRVWLSVRRKGTPGALTVAIYSDSTGSVDALLSSISVTYDRMDDILNEWLNETISQAVSSGAYYWLVVYGASGDNDKKHWMIATKEQVGSSYYSESFDSTPTAASFDLYFRLTAADTDKTCIPFEYKEQQYFVISPSTGAPKIYMAGDRGTADANTGQLSKLIDATKATWTVNEWVGYVVMITDGTGKLEPQQWRTITANTATGELTVDSPWTITHDTTTEYVILGTRLTEITGHGLTAPVTSVLVTTKGIILFAQGDSVNIRRMKFETAAGVWTQSQADDGTNRAVFMAYKPQSQKIVKANNSDGSGNVSVAFGAPVEWATAAHTFATAINVDSKYRRINGLIVYPDLNGAEQALVFKTDVPFWVPESGTSPYPMDIEEMKTVRSQNNGRNPMRNGVYLYFPMLQGLERYYSGAVDDMGPNLGDGLPTNRRGAIIAMQGYPGKFFIAVDAGSAGYSSVLDSGGWHERYRAPKGQRIQAMAFQVTPGTGLDRLWIYQGNDLIWLPFPSDSTNELQDTAYEYTPEFAVEFSRMHAGMFDVQKLVKKIKVQSESLEVDVDTGKPICWFEMDYRLNEDEEWTTLDDIFKTSPTQEIDFTEIYGIAGKRLKFRVRGYTRDKAKTPAFLAVIVSAVTRVDVKNMYGPYTFLIEDDEKVKGLRETGDEYKAAEKLKMLEDWGDASNDSMLMLKSVASLCDSKMIFMNTGTRRQIRFKKLNGNEFTSDAYLVSVTFQEA
jgi:hypothetical protein